METCSRERPRGWGHRPRGVRLSERPIHVHGCRQLPAGARPRQRLGL